MIRPATREDMPRILELYTEARAFMASHGNPPHWRDGYPEKQLEEDLRYGHLFVVIRDGIIVGVFALSQGRESSAYDRIQGSWRSEAPRGNLNRIAGAGPEKGISEEIFNWCKERHDHLRIDTHENNEVMRYLVLKHGFELRGRIVYDDNSVSDGFDWLREPEEE